MANTAQASPNGTVAMTMMALQTLSNCAASTSRITDQRKAEGDDQPVIALAEGLRPRPSARCRLPSGKRGWAMRHGLVIGVAEGEAVGQRGGDRDGAALLLAAERGRDRLLASGVAMVDIGT